MLIKRTAHGKIFFTEISFNKSTKIILKWLRKGQILEVSAAARSIIFAACVTDSDFSNAIAIPHKTDFDLSLEFLKA